MSILDIFTISPLQRPRGISQNVSGLYYVRRGSGYQIHMCVKLYYLGRAKVFSGVATDFGSWTTWYICDFFLFHIEIEGKGGWIIWGAGGGKGYVAPPLSNYWGGGGLAPTSPPPPLFLRLCFSYTLSNAPFRKMLLSRGTVGLIWYMYLRTISCPERPHEKLKPKFYIQSTLVISISVISNNRLSRRENLILVLTKKSNIR